MTDDPLTDARRALAILLTHLEAARNAAGAALSRMERAPPMTPPAWMPASEFRGEPGETPWLWVRTDTAVLPQHVILDHRGMVPQLSGVLVCPIPPPPPLPDAEPALTPPGVWVRAEEFRGEANVNVYAWVCCGTCRGPGACVPFLEEMDVNQHGRSDVSAGCHVMRVDITPPAPPVAA